MTEQNKDGRANTGKQLCSPNEPFGVVIEMGFFLNKISPFGSVLSDVLLCRLFYAQTYTLHTD